MTAFLTVEDVSFSYAPDAPRILDGLSLEVQRGECLCLMGMNGCGKSTLIDCILGEHALTAGRIWLDGCDAVTMSARQRAQLASYVPQVHERTFPYEVRHIVSMGLTAKGGSAQGTEADDAEAVERALALCGMQRFASRPYTMLSGGEMQMVLLARALVQDAPLMLMDEPTAHLDFRNELIFLETVERLVRDGATVLMATHAPNQAFHLAAAGIPVRVALMKGGCVWACGAPDEVLDAEALRKVFGVDGEVMEASTARGPLHQIIPLHSCVCGGMPL